MNVKEEVKGAVDAALAPFRPLLEAFAGGQKPAVVSTQLATVEQHPVLAEALAKGINTPEKFTELVNDAAEGKALAAKPEPQPHEVQVAALAAEIDTAEKFAQLVAEAKAGREALASAREDAEAAAVAYYGQNAEELEVAKRGLTNSNDLSHIKSKTQEFWALAPGAGSDGKRRSQGNAPSVQSLSNNGNSTNAKPKSEAFDYSGAGYNGAKTVSNK